MDKKKKHIHIIQFMPYFPPHKGGVETVGEEIGKYWVSSGKGIFMNIVPHFEQDTFLQDESVEKIIFQEHVIGYKKDNYEILVVPSIEIINNFPLYKIWSQEYKSIQQYLQKKIQAEGTENFRIITHTRFFLTSLTGGIFARGNRIKWIHIEHGSSYVKLSSTIKSQLSIIYDKTLGKWIFKKADIVLAISGACKKFIHEKFIKRDVSVFYRGIDIAIKGVQVEKLQNKFPGKKIIGYVGRLYKWKNIESLIKAYYSLDPKVLNTIQLIIVGDGEDYQRLVSLDTGNKIYFTGGKTFEEALAYQRQFDIHIHPSSPGGGLATTLLQAMHFACLIIASPYEGAKEVIEDGKNGVLLKNDSMKEIQRGIICALGNIEKKQEYGILNKKIIQENFSWEKNIENLYNLVK